MFKSFKFYPLPAEWPSLFALAVSCDRILALIEIGGGLGKKIHAQHF
jgi:hypothetical protein